MAIEKYMLYHHPYSVCSIMVRYTLAIAGEPKDHDSAMEVEEKVIDVYHNEQMEEDYLCNINPKGQVPVLTSFVLDQPLPDSLDITHYIGDRYPSLFPAAHEREISRLMKELHSLSFFSLSFGGKPQMAKGLVRGIEDRLNAANISERYRKALEYKLSVTNEQKVQGVTWENISLNEQKAKALTMELASHLQPEKPWLFGLGQPSALDAHLVVFLARMQDVNRHDVIPPALEEYLDRAMSTPEWKVVMEGRRTKLNTHS